MESRKALRCGLICAVTATVLMLLGSALAFGQVYYGGIVGVATDSSGAIIPNGNSSGGQNRCGSKEGATALRR